MTVMLLTFVGVLVFLFVAISGILLILEHLDSTNDSEDVDDRSTSNTHLACAQSDKITH